MALQSKSDYLGLILFRHYKDKRISRTLLTSDDEVRIQLGCLFYLIILLFTVEGYMDY